MKEIAESLFRDAEIVMRTPEVEQHIYQMAESMFKDPQRRRNRTIEQVLSATRAGVPIEFALVQRLGLKKNESDFVKGDPESYAWDAEDSSGRRYECKTFKDRWFTYDPRFMRTARRNIEMLDFIVCGNCTVKKDRYVVRFRLLADAKTFFAFEKESQFSKKYYYDHEMAERFGYAFYNAEWRKK